MIRISFKTVGICDDEIEFDMMEKVLTDWRATDLQNWFLPIVYDI